MTSETLTRQQALLIHRYFDDECDEEQRREAERLLEHSAPAQTYLSALESLTEAVRAAEDHAWKQASVDPVDKLMDRVVQAQPLHELSLDELAPLLERFHDGEAAPPEAAAIEAVAARRDDVADYLTELERLSDGIRQVDPGGDVDFEGFWDGIEEAIDEVERNNDDASPPAVAVDPFDPQRHATIVQRYHDGEATPEQRRQVDAWLQGGDEQVETMLEALQQINRGVNAGVEAAVERTDVDDIRRGVEQRLDAIEAEQSADNVVSLQHRDDDGPHSSDGSHWAKPLMAVAAAVALLVTGALVGPQLLDDQPPETETILIVEEVETAPGSSVRLQSPQLADYEVPEGVEFEPAVNRTANGPAIDAEHDEGEPTILWIEDDEDDEDDEEPDPEDETEELPGPI